GALDAVWQNAPFPLTGDETAPFDTGLYAVTEMLVGGLLALFEGNVVRREVDGAAIHAGFFVDARDMYERLREMAPEKRAKIQMKPVSFTNALYGDETGKRAARRHARFVNGAMQVSVLGDAMSDAAKPGQVVSGVGGQFNFFEQAFALEDGRAILTLPATRHSGGKVTSNIVWQLALTTVPRHMRDVVVTEYGTAFLRGQTDEDVIKRMIAIADSRFQTGLLDTARKAGKIEADWEIPESHRHNTPETLSRWLAPHRGALLPDFPLGTDFDDIEQVLLPALSRLAQDASSKPALARLIWASLAAPVHPREGEAMVRMGYNPAPELTEPLQSRALRGALRLCNRHRHSTG
ncbi:MAG: acetyl-CoA hydrolase/transferase C-terminal domain-containing protein, partial [Sulfitobacter sp.]